VQRHFLGEARNHWPGESDLEPEALTDGPEEIIRELVARRRSGHALALCFDYDGTLTPIVSHPRFARLSLPLRLVLKLLAERPHVSVGIISGRKLDDLRDLVALPGLFYGGSSGLEMDLMGTRLVPPGNDRAFELVDVLRPLLHAIVGPYHGAWLEDKGLGLTCHYRSVASQQIGPLRQAVLHALEHYSDEVVVLDGPMAIEIVPNRSWAKGPALATFLSSLGPAVVPFYAGDGANDADAIQVVNSAGGVSVGIGCNAPRSARFALSDPPALGSLLWRLLERLRMNHRTDAHVRV
jgi:trehalose-phosphatase